MEIKMKILLFFAVVSQVLLQLAESSATVQFKFLSFTNSDHRELDGDCCDDVIGWCDDFCDNRFIVCLDRDSTGFEGSTCDILRVQTAEIYPDDDSFYFPSPIPNGISRVQTTTVPSWPGGMEAFVQVWDVDNNSDDKVDQAVKSVNQAAERSVSSTAVWKEYTIGQQSDFKFELRVYCNSNFYGSDCNKHCVGQNNHLGHYHCDLSTGSKICYSGWTGLNCNLDYNECLSNPCTNGACTNGANRFDCTCANGWTGTKCDMNINDCASTPCKNNGICNDHVASYSCTCLTGHVYADHFCEYDDCASQPCMIGSTCLDLIGTFNCVCPLGFYGDLCEVDIDYCINQTCANGGTCVDRLDGFHCLCVKGYEGFLCDVETDECATGPCMHNATCHDLIGRYNCTCLKGYEGENCEIETDECLSSPCRNNATCEDQLAEYRCDCAPGFEGVTCATNVDECSSSPCFANETCADEINGYSCLRENLCDYSPCENNATCIDYPSFICVCASGYGGRMCSEDIDECANSPCANGTCVDHLDAFSCLCVPGFAGPTCESETNECNSFPCLNGTCEDLINGFLCHCMPGYSGIACEDDIDECARLPCEYGRCVHGINIYTCECVVDCVHGFCAHNGQCHCDDGYEGSDCSSQADFCRSSPCAKGTCNKKFNGYSCICDQFHTGDDCTVPIDNPCSFKPCIHNGDCETSNTAEDGYKCTCPSDFYGTKCQIDLKMYGATIFVTGKVESKSQLEAKLADLLHKQMNVASLRSKRQTANTGTVYVEIIRTEDYVKSVDSAPLTKVTFLARTESGYLTKDIAQQLIDSASDDLRTEFGYEVYKGAAEPLSGNKSWISSNWYVILLILAILAILGAAAFIIGKRRYSPSYWINPFKPKHRDERDLTNIQPPDATYSTSITNNLTRPTRTNTMESINPAYIPADHNAMTDCDEGGVCCNMAGDENGAAAALNHYDEIPAFRALSVVMENPYSEIKR